MFRRLKTLYEQGLIGKRFQSNYRLQGKPAAYYLTPEGARLLQKQQPDKPVSIQTIYKDKSVSELFIDKCLYILAMYCHLKAQYGDGLHFFTRSQLANRYDYFAEFTPAVYMRTEHGNAEQDFFLEYFQSSKPFYATVKRLKEYVEYADSGEWEAGTNSDFPKVLLICDSDRLRTRLLKSSSILDDADDDLKFFVSTKDLAEWYGLTEPEAPLSVSPIS